MTNIRVYAAEDDPIDQMSLRRQMSGQDSGIELTLYDNGADLRDGLLSAPPPECILLDMAMPVMDGFGVLDYLRSSPFSKIPVFVMSSSDAHAEMLGSEGCACAGYLNKPVSADALTTAIKALMQTNR